MRKMMTALAVSAALLGGVSGCGGPKDEPLPISTMLRLSDLPVPDGMKFVSARSHDRISPARRIIYHEYKGTKNTLAIINFCKDQLPASNWKFIDESTDKGITTLNYEKENERLTVRIYKKGFNTYLILQVYEKD